MQIQMFTRGILALALLLAPAVVAADIVSELHINPNGTFSAKNLVVTQKSGNNLFARATWGQAFVRTTLLLSGSTTVTKMHGEQAGVADIKEGDRIDVEGTLSSGAEGLIIAVRSVRDTTLLRDEKTLSGTISRTDGTALTFVLKNKPFGTTTVSVPASLEIKKGARIIQFADLTVGDKVLSATGSYDYTSNILSATALEIYQDPAVFKSRNFEGALESVAATTLPTTLLVRVGSTTYTVYVHSGASLLSKAKSPTTLSRFVVGDRVRFFGAVRKTNLLEIDAEVVRDMNF